MARQNFIEAAQDDFDRGGRDFIDRTSGKRYRLVRFDPTLSEDPRGDTGVELFYVTDDDWLVYLKPVGATGRSRTVNLGTVGAVKG